MTGDGFCGCGCGGRTNISVQTRLASGHVKGQPMRFIAGHQWRSWVPTAPDYRRCQMRAPGKPVREYVLVVEQALGHPLPEGAIVHHVDGDDANNAPTNLVACQDQAYHLLLHRRQRSLRACGHADWRKCLFCQQHDEPANIKMDTQGKTYHLACQRTAARAAKSARRVA